MSTIHQQEANRRNAERSTGPATQEGKSRSAQNALKHGLNSQQILLPSESAEEFQDHANSFQTEHHPQTPTEHFLVQQMIAASWRLARVRRLETAFYKTYADEKESDPEFLAFSRDVSRGPESKLTALARHESRLERTFYRALRELQRLQSLRPPAVVKVKEENWVRSVKSPQVPETTDPPRPPHHLPFLPPSLST